MKIRVLGSSDPEILQAVSPVVTVEAEYGDMCVEGLHTTMAHHGPRAGGRCPCAYTNADFAELRRYVKTIIIGVSHIDLDTIGGCAAVMGRHSQGGDMAVAFWRTAEFVDLNGVHRLNEAGDDLKIISGAGVSVEEALNAWWAWAEANRGPKFDNGIVDVTNHVLDATTVIGWLLVDVVASRFEGTEHEAEASRVAEKSAELVRKGMDWKVASEALREESFVAQRGSVVLRRADRFTNHLYASGVGAAVVGINHKTKSVTVSFADGDASPHSAIEVVQRLWGSLAGGHKGIAGSGSAQV